MAGKYDVVKLGVNKAINEAFGGIIGSYKAATRGVIRTVENTGATGVKATGNGFTILDDAAKSTTTQRVKLNAWDAIKEGHKGEAGAIDTFGGYSARKIAGSYIGVSAAGRIASGGGIYKDGNGNTDMIGIPLI